MTQRSGYLLQIAARTLAHCEQNVQSFWQGTRDHDVSQNIAVLRKHIVGPGHVDKGQSPRSCVESLPYMFAFAQSLRDRLRRIPGSACGPPAAARA